VSRFSRDLDPPDVALGIGAHPDDLEFECGATLAKWAKTGTTVHLLVCTDGSRGTWDPDVDSAELARTRKREQAAAADALGAAQPVVFIDRVDGELTADPDTRSLVAGWIRTLRPDIVLGHDPWRRYRLHPDHRAAGWLTVDGVVAARDAHFPAGGPGLDRHLPPHRPRALLLFEADEPDHVEDVNDHSDAKLAALEAHRSQFESTMGISPDAPQPEIDAFRARERERMTLDGRHVGVGLGEEFKLITDL